MPQADLKPLYDESLRKRLRLPWPDRVDPAAGSFSALRLRWADVGSRAARGGAPAWVIACDVLELDAPLVADRPLFLFARRIEISRDAQIVMALTGDASLLVVAQSCSREGTPAALPLSAVQANAVMTTLDWQPGAGAPCSAAQWQAGKIADLDLSQVDPAHLARGGEVLTLLKRLFYVAALISSTHPEESCGQLAWIGALAGLDRDGRALSGQAWAFAADLQQRTRAGGTLFVPPLDVDLYAEQAQLLGDRLSALDAAYQAVVDHSEDNEQWLAAAETALRVNTADARLGAALVARAEEAWQSTLLARTIAARQVAQLQLQIQFCEIEFKRGLAKWRQEALKESIFKMLLSVVEVAAAIGTLTVAANPKLLASKASEVGSSILSLDAGEEPDSSLAELPDTDKPPVRRGLVEDPDTDEEVHGAPGAPDLPDPAARHKSRPGVVFYQQAEAFVTEAVEKHGKALKDLGSNGAKFIEAALGVSKVLQQAAKIEAQSERILAATAAASKSQLGSVSLTGLAVVTGGDETWQALEISVCALFDGIGNTLTEIEGGTAYRQTFRRLLQAGGNLSRARLAVAAAAWQLADARIRAAATQDTAKWLEQRANDAEARVQRARQVRERLFESVVDARRDCYVTADRYRRAFEYFVLARPEDLPALPDMSGPALAFEAAMSAIAARSLSRDALRAVPQTLEALRYRIDDQQVIDAIRTNGGTTTFRIPTTAPEFAHLARLRVGRIRVFAEGLVGTEVSVALASSGFFEDIDRKGRLRRFAAASHRVIFVYQPAVGSGKPRIVMDGDIASRFQHDFFHPTPFSTWTIRLYSRTGQALDFSGLRALELVFSGEATAPDSL